MSAEKLTEVLREAEERLKDVREERRFILGQIGMHIGAREAATKRRAWERDEMRLRERIA